MEKYPVYMGSLWRYLHSCLGGFRVLPPAQVPLFILATRASVDVMVKVQTLSPETSLWMISIALASRPIPFFDCAFHLFNQFFRPSDCNSAATHPTSFFYNALSISAPTVLYRRLVDLTHNRACMFRCWWCSHYLENRIPKHKTLNAKRRTVTLVLISNDRRVSFLLRFLTLPRRLCITEISQIATDSACKSLASPSSFFHSWPSADWTRKRYQWKRETSNRENPNEP